LRRSKLATTLRRVRAQSAALRALSASGDVRPQSGDETSDVCAGFLGVRLDGAPRRTRTHDTAQPVQSRCIMQNGSTSMSCDEELDARIREHHAQGDCDTAATLIIRGYGRSVNHFLVSRVCSPVLVSEIFSLFCEQLWRGLPSVRWRSSVRGWVFVLARNAMYQYLSSMRKLRARYVPLLEEPSIVEEFESAIGARPDEETAEERLRLLCAALSEQDARLLTMRARLALPWEEIARRMVDASASDSDAAVRREAARLRKRFQLIKDRLRRRATDISLERVSARRGAEVHAEP
jgi:RNA polymerase sigma-70 factor (ECF subfamily)